MKRRLGALHPQAEEADVRALIQAPLPDIDLKAIFEAVDGEKIKTCTLRTEGAAGVSQATDKLWRKMVSSFEESSVDLCKAVAVESPPSTLIRLLYRTCCRIKGSRSTRCRVSGQSASAK